MRRHRPPAGCQQHPATGPSARPSLACAYALTGREQQVIGLVLRGRSTRQIARDLVVSPYTVREHLKTVFDKIGVHSRRELVGQVFFQHCLPAIS
jgi:DNA-binding NarL/FixJ family response regulator